MPQFLATLDRGTFKNYKEIYSSPTITTGQLTLNLNNGNVFNVNLNANITIMTISNVPSSSFAANFSLIFTADGTARGVAWSPAIKWPAGTPPTLTSTNGKRDVFSFITLDGGTNWYGFVGGQNI
jgi:hypothetical protein